ncbi:MAG TPA: glycosyltransferase family 2 protein [Candidatus Angelobacter sp.]|nr:glycosyltransferase family 2 protein [Candidatus Angelobacter sp.]
MSSMPFVSIVVPTNNRRSAVTRCVESILRSDYDRFEVVVVDDGSTDGTSDQISKLFPNISLIRHEKRGLASEARNTGAKHSKGDLVYFVDDDNVVDPRAVSELVKAISNNADVGIAGPIMYYLRDPEHVWCSGISRNLLTSITKFSTEKPKGSSACYSTDDIPNAFMVRKRVFDDVGGFDQVGFVQHLAEADFCIRASRKGFEVIMVPKAAIWHDVPVRKWPYRGARNLHMSSSDRTYHVARSRILFMRKYAGPWRFVLFTVAFLPPIALSCIVMILKEKSIGDQRGAFAGSYVRGLIDGLSMISSCRHGAAPLQIPKDHA